MIDISGYTVNEKIYEGAKSQVYRAIRQADSTPVVVKILNNDYPNFKELVLFKNQYAIAKNLDISGIVKPYTLENYGHGLALVMEDFGGISLADYAAEKPLKIDEFFPIAIAITHILETLIRHRIIHKDIKPQNILINPETKQVKLIDFSISSLLPRERQELQNPNILEGTLFYMSPEQTGRMNRGIDYRTDFYSLGVTFYQLLTGELPFTAIEPMELVHCHIAKKPTPPIEVNPIVPPMLNAIVLKLMAKIAEDRYQSANGIKHDLETCWQQWQNRGEIAAFELGKKDLCDRFVIPEKLYGRENEVAALLAAFGRVASPETENRVTGVGAGVGADLAENPSRQQTISLQNPPFQNPSPSSEMMLVAGYSGIGKTAVVNEIHKPILRQRGYFIKGKFDQFGRNIPFSALVQAFRNLIGQLLTETTASVEQWKAKILNALGENAQAIVDVIPELELIIGKQPPLGELSGTAAQNRFNRLFQKFIQVFAQAENFGNADKTPATLVIFLDDLQWADSASLKLMELLISETDTRHLLLIGAYRDNEINIGHPLTLALENIRKAGARVNQITLAPLDRPSLNRLIADTLLCSPERANPLTKLVYKKTHGNPFFATQFLKSLYEDGLINFDVEAGYWQCDIAKIRELAVTDDVVEFMALQLQKLPENTQNVLKIAACVGHQFDLATLAIALEKSQAETASDLWKALQEELILPQSEVYKFFTHEEGLGTRNREQETGNNSQSPNEEGLGTRDWGRGTGNNYSLPMTHYQLPKYKFLHDRVQQAAYSLIPQAQKQATHLKIGQLLLSNTQIEEREEKIFDIVNQLNYGVALILRETERSELAQLNLMAGTKAKAATAYAAAVEYLTVGRELLASDSLRDSGASRWETQYELTLAMYVTAAEAAYLSYDFQQMEELADVVLQNAKTLQDKVKVYEIQLSAYTAQVKPKQAVEMGIEVLKLLGVNFPENPNPGDIQQGLESTASLFAGKKIADFINLPDMMEPDKQAALRILAGLVSPAYISAPLLLPLIILQMVHLSVRHGNAPLSAFAYGLYGLILSGVVQDIETGYEFGQLALNLVDRLNANSLKTKIFYTVGVHIIHGKHHVKDTLPLLREGYERGLTTGELELGYSAKEISQYSYLIGSELAELEPEIAIYSKALVHFKQSAALNYNRIVNQAVLNLLGRSENPCILSGDAYNEEKMLPFHIEANDRTGLHFFHFHKMLVCYLFEEARQAFANSEKAEQYLDAVTGMLNVPAFYFYDSLARLAVYSEAIASEKEQHLLKVKSNQEKLQKWAHHAPMNFLHKFYLVEAERFRVLGENVEAMEAYEKAIALAKEYEYVNEEAIAHELAAKFYLAWGKEKIAQTYLTDAYYSYARWGAKAKIENLESRYPQLLAPMLKREKLSLNPSATLATMTAGTVTTHSTSSASALLDVSSAIKASQALSGEIHLEQLLSKLMKAVMENAGAESGALLLSEEGHLQLAAYCFNSRDCNVQSMAVELSSEVPISLLNYVSRTQKTLVIDDATADKNWAADPYIQLHQPKSILCAPLLNRGQLIGILYLENHLTTRAFTSDRLDILSVLCSQAAISLENARLYQKSQEYAQRLERSLQELQQAQLQLIQSEKMSALGQLVAGVAHEINNPLGFISGNLMQAEEFLQDVLKILQLYQQKFPKPGDEIEREIETVELDYVVEDLPKILGSMKVGTERIRNISTSLRTFSRSDTLEKVDFNIHDGIDSTIMILKHRLKASEKRPAIEIVKQYGDLPLVPCYPGQLNQVFMNIVANAIDAMDDFNQGHSYEEIKAHPNKIIIRTEMSADKQSVTIRIADNGAGMSEEVKQRVFEHLFTTKPVGKGTGLGLSISRQIVVEKHGGQLTCFSAPGEGSEFAIALPLR